MRPWTWTWILLFPCIKQVQGIVLWNQKQHVETIKEFHRHYNFKEIFLVYPEESAFELNELFTLIWTISVAFNIRTKDTNSLSSQSLIHYHDR